MFAALLASLFALLALAAAQNAYAQAHGEVWRLTRVDGAVFVRERNRAWRGAAHDALSIGAIVTTGAASHATLENGAQHIEMSPNSRMTLSARSTEGMTRILQDLGSLFFQVDHRATPHFAVETPRLAAIVKGTSFTVTVTPRCDTVSVAHGLVDVHALQVRAQTDVATGQSARVMTLRPQDVVLNTGAGFPPEASAPDDVGGLRDGSGNTAPQSAQSRSGATGARTGSAVASAPASSMPTPVLQPALGPSAPATAPIFVRGPAVSGVSGGQAGFLRFMFTYFAACLAIGFGAFIVFRVLESSDRRRRASR